VMKVTKVTGIGENYLSCPRNVLFFIYAVCQRGGEGEEYVQ
jgi:hypothetical protein